ncbi:hypothetical protein EQV77_17530 [Halobacillus fulvus]|nr:hypothetical protein EQV77_17530 [Halobacillus fulvus]
MKKKYMLHTLLLMMAFLILVPAVAAASTIGPSEWTQYRLNSENNPVYESDFDQKLEDAIETNDQIRSTPVVVGNNIYIGNHNTGDIFSYNLIDQEMNWESQAPNWIHSELIYVGDQLFVGYGNRFYQEDGTRGTGESGMMSLDPATGETLWNFETKGEVMPTPAYHDGTVYIGTGDRHIYAVNPETGEEEWKLDLGHEMSMSSPNIKDGVLYVGGGKPAPYTFSAVDLETQEILWQTEFPDVYLGLDDVPPSIHENLIYTTGLVKTDDYNQPEHVLYALNIETGEMEWQDSLGTGDMVPNNKSGAPVVHEGKVFVGSPITKSFYAYEAETGEQLWSYESNVNKAPPVANEGTVYFTDAEGIVYAFDTENGELLGEQQLGGTLAPSGPIVMNDHLIVGSQDSNAYVVPTNTLVNGESSVENEASDPDEGMNLTWVILPVLLILIAGIVLFVRRTKN